MAITKQRVEEIISRIEMYGHGAGYTVEEVYDLAVLALNLSNIAKLKRYELDMDGCDSFGQDCGADMTEDSDGDYVLFDDVVKLFEFDTTTQKLESTERRQPVSEIDYQALRDKAEKATCGEWSIEYGDGSFDGDDALIHREAAGYIPICRIEGAHPESGFDEDFQMEQQANAEFIAAANPATVLALLGELEAAKKRIAELEAELVSQTYKLNELSGNYPVTPDGWISCSERMPKGYADVLVTDGEHVEVKWWDESGYWHSWTELNSDIFADEITHWMPLPEPPQEVNRG